MSKSLPLSPLTQALRAAVLPLAALWLWGDAQRVAAPPSPALAPVARSGGRAPASVVTDRDDPLYGMNLEVFERAMRRRTQKRTSEPPAPEAPRGATRPSAQNPFVTALALAPAPAPAPATGEIRLQPPREDLLITPLPPRSTAETCLRPERKPRVPKTRVERAPRSAERGFPNEWVETMRARARRNQLHYDVESVLDVYERSADAVSSYNLSDSDSWKSCFKGVQDYQSGFEIPHEGMSRTARLSFSRRTDRGNLASFSDGTRGSYRGTAHTERRGSILPTAGRGLVIRGRISTFAGPFDTGLGHDETGALDRKPVLLKRGYRWEDSGRVNVYGEPIERAVAREPDYGCAMRWNYLLRNSDGKVEKNFPAILRSKRLILHDPVRNTAAVCQPIDWGPNASTTNKDVDVTPDVLEALGSSAIDDRGPSHVEIAIAPDSMPLGPVRPSADCSGGLAPVAPAYGTESASGDPARDTVYADNADTGACAALPPQTAKSSFGEPSAPYTPIPEATAPLSATAR